MIDHTEKMKCRHCDFVVDRWSKHKTRNPQTLEMEYKEVGLSKLRSHCQYAHKDVSKYLSALHWKSVNNARVYNVRAKMENE